MTKLAVYKYRIKDFKSRTLFAKTGEALSGREELGKLLVARSLNIYKPCSDGLPETLRTENVCHNDVAVFTIENNKTISQWLNKKKNSLPNNPYCWVIIDNRPDEMKMFIEHNSAFGNPDVLRDILQSNFNVKLNEVGFNIEIEAKMEEKEFWTVVDERCRKNNDSVSKVVFELVNPEKAEGISLPIRRYAFLNATLGVMEATNTYKSTFSMEANKRDHILLARTRRDLSQMVRLCCNNGYSITVYFRKSGRYVTGDMERVYENVEEGFLTLFTNNTTTISNDDGYTYDLLLWLDSISGNKKNVNKTKKK